MLSAGKHRQTELLALSLAIGLHTAACLYLHPVSDGPAQAAPPLLLHVSLQADMLPSSPALTPHNNHTVRKQPSMYKPAAQPERSYTPPTPPLLQTGPAKSVLPALPANNSNSSRINPVSSNAQDNHATSGASNPQPVATAGINGPLHLAGELSVVCSERPQPVYPAISRRLGEEGQVLLRVELDEQGRIGRVSVQNSSGYPALDRAAESAVHNWHCSAPIRNGQVTPAIAMQPFHFSLRD